MFASGRLLHRYTFLHNVYRPAEYEQQFLHRHCEVGRAWPQVAVDERRAAPAPPEVTSQDWSSQYLIFLTSLARTSSQPLQLLHLQRCACTRSQIGPCNCLHACRPLTSCFC